MNFCCEEKEDLLGRPAEVTSRATKLRPNTLIHDVNTQELGTERQ